MSAPRKSLSALAENFGPPLVFLAVTLIFIVAAYGYPPASREVPLLIGYVLIVLIALDILSRTSTSTGELVRRYLNPASGLPGVPKIGRRRRRRTSFRAKGTIGRRLGRRIYSRRHDGRHSPCSAGLCRILHDRRGPQERQVQHPDRSFDRTVPLAQLRDDPFHPPLPRHALRMMRMKSIQEL